MEAIVSLILGLAAGLLVGGAAIWLVQGSRARAHLAQMESQHNAQVAGLEGQLKQTETTSNILNTAKEQLSEAFQATASRALQSNNELFMNVAQQKLGTTLESAKGEFKQRHEQFQALVKPLSQSYDKLNPNIETLIQQNRELAVETGKLSTALTDSQQIGSWGEVQLRRVVELAGMVEHCDFVEQTSIEGSQDRPDLMVRLPERRTIVVDSKASTKAYMEAQQTEDDATKSQILEHHAGALRTQVDDLARKNYSRMEGSLDFVVMFVPADQFLVTALSANPGLIEYAFGKRIAIATPATLISLLWAVANGWQQHRMAENAEAIRVAAEEMHSRMLTFINHYQSVGKQLQSAVDAYNQSIGSFDRRVIPQGRKFAGLATKGEDSIASPSQLEQGIRTSQYAGLLGAASDSDD